MALHFAISADLNGRPVLDIADYDYNANGKHHRMTGHTIVYSEDQARIEITQEDADAIRAFLDEYFPMQASKVNVTQTAQVIEEGATMIGYQGGTIG